MASVQAIPDFEVLKEPRGLLRFLSHFFLLTGLLRNISQSSTVVVRSSGVLNSLSLFDSPHSEAHLHCQGVRSNTTWPNHSTNLLPIQVGALSFDHPSSGNHRNWSVDSIRLDTDGQTWKYSEMCGLKDVQKDGGSLYDLKFPGNFSSDAEFFVFTGVFAWLYCFLRSGKLLTWISRWLKQYNWLYICATLSLAVYVFFNHLYIDQQKNYPKVKNGATLLHIQGSISLQVDFVLTALLGMFWLAGSAAWANGLNGR